MKTAELIAKILLKEKAVFLRPEDPFTWTSGIKSTIYCDNRLLISTIESRDTIVKAFAAAIKPMHVKCIAGTATAGIPWAAWIAMEMKLPLIYVRSGAKDHGRQNAIEGTVPTGTKTILIEDLISTGKSSIAAAVKLQEAGLLIDTVMSIFSYGFHQATEVFEKANLKYHSLSTFEVLAQVAYDDKLLNQKNLTNVLEWKKSVTFP